MCSFQQVACGMKNSKFLSTAMYEGFFAGFEILIPGCFA